MTNEEIAARLRAHKSNFFATYDNIEKVLDYAKSGDNSSAANLAGISVMIGINTILELIAAQIEGEQDNE